MSAILGLDVGDVRIGIAVGNTVTRLPSPLTTLPNNAETLNHLRQLIQQHHVEVLVVGLPRNLSGNDTTQTVKSRNFAKKLHQELNLPVYLNDEALSSKRAEAELLRRGKPFKPEEIDSLAATLILEDYFENPSSAEKV